VYEGRLADSSLTNNEDLNDWHKPRLLCTQGRIRLFSGDQWICPNTSKLTDLAFIKVIVLLANSLEDFGKNQLVFTYVKRLPCMQGKTPGELLVEVP
jgi:hypothetical protein